MCFKELLDLLSLDLAIQGQNAGFDNPAGATLWNPSRAKKIKIALGS
jgi:hypothetical protein